MIEGAVRERKRVRRSLDQLDSVAEAATGDGEHLGALVDTGDLEATAEELSGDEPGSGRDVEDVPARREPRDEELSPQGILAERECSADSVVRRSEWGEQLSRVDTGHAPRILVTVGLADELEGVGALAAAHAGPGDVVSGIIASEPGDGQRLYLCSFDDADGRRSWLAIRDDGAPVASRAELRAAVSIAALCEVAEDAAGGGDLDALIATLVEIREREAPPGIEDAEAAARALRSVLGEPPQVASPARLDEIGAATRRLERELDSSTSSPFAAALQSSLGAVSELEREIEAGYRIELR